MTKKEIAYTRICDDIFCRNLLPGNKINISELAEKYGMSAIPIREALTQLETENMVKNIPYRGYIVSSVVFNDFLEYSLIRNELACLALRYGIAYLTDESLGHIKCLQKTLEELYKAGDYEQYVIVNRKFYDALYSFAPCTKLQEMIETVTKCAYHRQSILLLVPSRIKTSLEEHDSLIRAIEARDTERATQILFFHRLNTLLSLVQEMKYNLMKPNYMEQEVLTAFFTEEQLKNRTVVTGEVEYWNYILEHLTNA